MAGTLDDVGECARPARPSSRAAPELHDASRCASWAVEEQFAQPVYLKVKRLIDLVLASFALLLVLPVLTLAGIAIKLDTKGPIVFKQRRMRARRRILEGRPVWVVEPFMIYKLRTMVHGADQKPQHARMRAYILGDETHFDSESEGVRFNGSFKPDNDERVTRIGSLLRRLSIDEMPQLWNVIKGDMSLVGPRPPMPSEVELYDTRQLSYLATPCGITGWAQVNGRCTIDFAEMLALSFEYLERRSLLFDLRILTQTIPTVLSRQGAE